MSSSLAPECSEVKERYDQCFIKWYSEKYLRGEAKTDDCKKLFDIYKECLSKAMKAKGIDTMLAEARKNSKDLDMDIGQSR
ncbi:putative mitochondrial distribution and morphology protein [Terfezia boudieri ATCC MYA-4762]|uniref:Putative mitochondrial distribution and morphology protein n=1 Tax=Terfezia boudieri ATCC MYA-4762 TaxID=1051890 RepID=A0A3N4LA86_9PEZI|nr:putative mitochondrial distribution and morphology protein [Terfezia boudieri ATCC MYA-4762]